MMHLDRLIEDTRQNDPILAGKAALELAEMQTLIAGLLTQYWRLEEEGNYVVCRFCGESAWRGMDIQHLPRCLVKRGQELLSVENA